MMEAAYPALGQLTWLNCLLSGGVDLVPILELETDENVELDQWNTTVGV